MRFSFFLSLFTSGLLTVPNNMLRKRKSQKDIDYRFFIQISNKKYWKYESFEIFSTTLPFSIYRRFENSFLFMRWVFEWKVVVILDGFLLILLRAFLGRKKRVCFWGVFEWNSSTEMWVLLDDHHACTLLNTNIQLIHVANLQDFYSTFFLPTSD